MVPVILPFVRAEVNAGTASAARIAIIAITTSNSISVNAEKYFFIWIFILGFFVSAGCSEGFLVAAIDLNRLGGLVNRPYQFILRGCCSGVFVWFRLRSVQGG